MTFVILLLVFCSVFFVVVLLCSFFFRCFSSFLLLSVVLLVVVFVFRFFVVFLFFPSDCVLIGVSGVSVASSEGNDSSGTLPDRGARMALAGGVPSVPCGL